MRVECIVSGATVRLVDVQVNKGDRGTLDTLLTGWPGWKRAISISGRSVYTAPLAPSTVLPLVSSLKLEIDWRDAESRDAVARVAAQATHAKTAVDASGTFVPTGPWPTERRPLPHQARAIRAIHMMDYKVLLADWMGLGKSATALWSVDASGVQGVLIICPVSVKWNWAKEIEATLGERWSSIVIGGTAKDRAGQFVDARTAMESGERTALILNYDLLRYSTSSQLELLEAWACDQAIIYDESHYLKTRTAARTKIAMKIAKTARVRMLLSGTPIRNMADDLFTQLEIVRPQTWTSYWDFAKRHLNIQSVTFGKQKTRKVIGVKNLGALNAVVNTMQIRRELGEVGGLPEKTFTYPELTLTDEMRRIYDAMREHAVMLLKQVDDDSTSVFDHRVRGAVEVALRCEQIAQGFIGGVPEPLQKVINKSAHKIAGRPGEFVFPSAPKIVWLLETLEAICVQGGRPVVFSRFNAPMFWLAEQVEGSTLLHGALSGEEKRERIDRFQEGIGRVFFCQVRMAEGFNLTASQDVIFLGRDWSPAINAQAVARCHRLGQKGTVNVQIPIVRETLEVTFHRRLLSKASDASDALQPLTVKELIEAL